MSFKTIQGYTPFAYQSDAIQKSINFCLNNGGCMINHQTGLGKTIIGSFTAINLGETILVISPKNNQRSWTNILPNATICTKASIPNKQFDVIIVDEAHNFGNIKNKSYQELVRTIYCQGADKFPYVILMTATPVNNNMGEFYNMVRLIPFRTHTPMFWLLPNLYAHSVTIEKELKTKQRFKPNESFKDISERVDLEFKFDKTLKKMGESLSLFSVRETRQSITKNYPTDIELMGSFPKIGHTSVNYELDTKLVVQTIKLIESMPFAYYNYMNYIEKPQKSGLGGVMKCLLFKRLDSSVAAFKKTIATITNTLSTFVYNRGTLTLEEGDEIGVNSNFMVDNSTDLDCLEKIRGLWLCKLSDSERLDCDDRLKMEHLKNIVSQTNEKIVIFTEYQTTKDLILRELEKEFKTIGFDSTTNEKVLDVIGANFDANADKKENKYDILVTTDVLSEGVNLHQAKVLIHFDTKWNPSRLEQREGRVDRIMKNVTTVKDVNVFTFAVDSIVESIIKLEKKITHKKGISEILLSGEPFKFYPCLKPFSYYDKWFEAVVLNFEAGAVVFKKKHIFTSGMELYDGDLNTNLTFLGIQKTIKLNGCYYKLRNAFGMGGDFHGGDFSGVGGLFDNFYKIRPKDFTSAIINNFSYTELLNISNIKHKGLVNIEGLVSERFFTNFYTSFPTFTEITKTVFLSNDRSKDAPVSALV